MFTEELVFSGAPIDLEKVPSTDDGALILNARPVRAGDYDYYGYELTGAEERGYAWDQPLVGRVTEEALKATLEQFEGLAITDDHIFIPVGERGDYGIGTILRPGVLDAEGYVNTRAEVHEPKAVLKITQGSARELSIGFRSLIQWVDNPGEGDPHFFVTGIELNHVALVEEGRAGPKARLLNHTATLEHTAMKKITIGGKEYEVADEVATEFSRINTEAGTAAAKITQAEAERDAARGERDAARQEVANAKSGVDTAAAKLAADHADLVTEAAKLGNKDDLVLGQYDSAKVKRDILAGRGIKVPDDASPEYIAGAWGAALANAKEVAPNSKPKAGAFSALDGTGGAAEETAMTNAAAASEKVHGSYFGGAKKQEKK